MKVLSAHYTNPEGTAAIVITDNAGAVALSAPDHPEAFAALLASGVAIAPYEAPPAPVRCASALALRYALNESGQRAAWDAALAALSQGTRDYWVSEPNPPETSPKLNRIAAAAGIDLKALFDRARAG